MADPMPPDVLLAVIEVIPESLYNDARHAAIRALANGRREINRLSAMSGGLGDDVRADSERYISKLETLMEILEKAP